MSHSTPLTHYARNRRRLMMELIQNPTNKYHELHNKVVTVSQQIIGKTTSEACKICEDNGLQYRWVSINGAGCMVTADVKFDRIGFHVENGIVAEVNNG